MAKKRVHEIAKEKGISSKEVLAVLQAAGVDAKAAASSVDEGEIERAFSAKNGGGDDGRADAASVKDPAKEAPEQATPAPAGEQPAPAERPAPSRPAGGGAGARRRRVVIDSQASRRQSGPPPPQQQPPRRR